MFHFVCSASLVAAGRAPSPLWLAFAMFFLGMFAAIYHPVGMAMLLDVSKARPRTLAFNGVGGKLGGTPPPGVFTTLAAWIGCAAPVLVPAPSCPCARVAHPVP